MGYSYFKINDDIKTPEYFFIGGRGSTRRLCDIFEEAQRKLLTARVTDHFFDSTNYVWLIGEYENVPSNANTLFGIKIVLVNGIGIRLYKEV